MLRAGPAAVLAATCVIGGCGGRVEHYTTVPTVRAATVVAGGIDILVVREHGSRTYEDPSWIDNSLVFDSVSERMTGAESTYERVGFIRVDPTTGSCRFDAGTPRPPTRRMSSSPVPNVGSHLPPWLPPFSEATWLPEATWRIGETLGHATLAAEDGHLVVRWQFRHLTLPAAVDSAVRVFGGRYAAVADVVVDLEGGEILTKLVHVTRVGAVRDEVLIQADGVFWEAPSSLTRISSVRTRDLIPVGMTGTTLVLHSRARHSVLLFDPDAKTWREVSYATCLPGSTATP